MKKRLLTLIVPTTLGEAIMIVFILGLLSPASAIDYRYTDNGNGTVKDTMTGYMWQKEDDNKTRTWEQAIAYCKGLSLASHKDWRLPILYVLSTIVARGSYRPAIDTTYFPNTKLWGYWSSTDDQTGAWDWDFYRGQKASGSKAGKHYVRCVRGVSRYTDNGNYTVTDTMTGYMWQGIYSVGQYYYTWEEAIAYCKSMSLASYKDWRLPKIVELASLIYKNIDSGVLLHFYFKTNPHKFLYWSSTTYPGNSSEALVFDFISGDLFRYPKTKDIDPDVRCVRGGQ